MAPDPRKAAVVKEKRGKRTTNLVWTAGKYKEYEKRRRDTFNTKMTILGKLLPNFDREQVGKTIAHLNWGIFK